MKSAKILTVFLILALAAGCGSSGSGGSGATSQGGGGTPPPSPGSNVLSITVNGSLCSSNSYPNKPCVSVTICTPGTSTCQTINDILLDTGSSGLRIFKTALSVSLTQVASGSGSLAECIQYADGTSDWGPVQTAGIILGNEPAVEVPIQVIDSTFGTAPSGCQNADQSPAEAGFNGILGVSFFAQDCGSVCANAANSGIYYTCTGSACSGTRAALSSQVQNPVSLLPQDNNGVIVQLPSIPSDGSASIDGSLVLGIGTSSNNVPSAVTTYQADQFGNFVTSFNNTSYSSYIDTGTNGLFFPSPSASQLPNCSFPDSDWFCPQSTVDLSATTEGASGSPSGGVPFQIGNFEILINSSNNVFDDIGGQQYGEFDWGLPVFFGRDIYIGFEGKSSSLGSGPFWAY
jgi:hypothetical protein